MTFIAGAMIASAAIGAGASMYGANQASGALTAGTNKAIKEQQRQFNRTLALQEPSRRLGYQAMGA